MKIAIVGGGVAGLVCAHYLHPRHEIALFEAGPEPGGHVNTHDVQQQDRGYAVDSGFIVFNDRNYPNFVRLLDELGVASQRSSMSFSVSCSRTGLEYNGTTLNTLFAQRRNLLRPSFWRMIREILRFNKRASSLVAAGGEEMTLGELLDAGGFTPRLRNHYVIPMGAAIWSTPPDAMLDFPARFFVDFFERHGMLTVNRRPQWRVVRGGSRTYVEALVRPFEDRMHLGCAVTSIRRSPDAVDVQTELGSGRFDEVVIATHSDQALRMLEDASPAEQDILGSMPFQPNEAVLHTHAGILPRSRRAWAAWNYHVPRDRRDHVLVTYNMNVLQSLDAPEPFLVTLNDAGSIPADKVLRRIHYTHPVYTPAGVAARARRGEIDGVRRTHYCGAYWGAGFHEDGVVSALTVCRRFGAGP